MTILVTGATGLVGTRLLPRLVASGVTCRALVRGGKLATDEVTTIDGDLLDPASLDAAVEGVTAVIHLAAVLRTPDASLIHRVNLEGTNNLIMAVRAGAPNARVIMASTGLVYDPGTSRPAREHDACHPATPYPASKVAAEASLMASGLDWTIQRFGFVYGDGDGHLAALLGLAERFDWHPAMALSLIHHRDIAAAVALALAGGMAGRIVNIVDEAPMTLFELCEIAGHPVAASASPLANPWSGRLDGELARSLGFRPSVRTVRQAQEEGIL
ncbi:NAD(P)-dependent oxidoreductase [Sphingomonas sp. ASV193]|uniref:NAD-dependent epimerase/dehydratase family protein n=1 Tax=Sphingomonas sp. ASV193 TaxID=3144405 RepID=UPI0032E8EC69